jgi:hypothetical protein
MYDNKFTGCCTVLTTLTTLVQPLPWGLCDSHVYSFTIIMFLTHYDPVVRVPVRVIVRVAVVRPICDAVHTSNGNLGRLYARHAGTKGEYSAVGIFKITYLHRFAGV